MIRVLSSRLTSVALHPGFAGYALKQAFLWLAVPVSLWLVFASDVEALHNALHSTRHAASFFICH